ncbi:MAG: hypothetical protein RBR20_13450 [Desulfobacterales bacterium]|nr:hypothetical protein [Desulfobacterales bacterium]
MRRRIWRVDFFIDENGGLLGAGGYQNGDINHAVLLGGLQLFSFHDKYRPITPVSPWFFKVGADSSEAIQFQTEKLSDRGKTAPDPGVPRSGPAENSGGFAMLERGKDGFGPSGSDPGRLRFVRTETPCDFFERVFAFPGLWRLPHPGQGLTVEIFGQNAYALFPYMAKWQGMVFAYPNHVAFMNARHAALGSHIKIRSNPGIGEAPGGYNLNHSAHGLLDGRRCCVPADNISHRWIIFHDFLLFCGRKVMSEELPLAQFVVFANSMRLIDNRFPAA